MGLVFKQASQSGITAPDYGTAIRNITEQLKARKLKSLDKELGDYFTSTALYPKIRPDSSLVSSFT